MSTFKLIKLPLVSWRFHRFVFASPNIPFHKLREKYIVAHFPIYKLKIKLLSNIFYKFTISDCVIKLGIFPSWNYLNLGMIRIYIFFKSSNLLLAIEAWPLPSGFPEIPVAACIVVTCPKVNFQIIYNRIVALFHYFPYHKVSWFNSANFDIESLHFQSKNVRVRFDTMFGYAINPKEWSYNTTQRWRDVDNSSLTFPD